MARFEFDPVAHRYTLDGRVLPSVTQILRGLDDFSHVPARVLERARDRGTRVHSACNLDVLGTLDEATVDDEVAPRTRLIPPICNHLPAPGTKFTWAGEVYILEAR